MAAEAARAAAGPPGQPRLTAWTCSLRSGRLGRPVASLSLVGAPKPTTPQIEGSQRDVKSTHSGRRSPSASVRRNTAGGRGRRGRARRGRPGDRELEHAQGGRRTCTSRTTPDQVVPGEGGRHARGGGGRAVRLRGLHLPGRDDPPHHLPEDHQPETNCWAFWPPVSPSGSGAVTKQSGISGKLGTFKNHGVTQVTLNGQPAVLLHARHPGPRTSTRPGRRAQDVRLDLAHREGLRVGVALGAADVAVADAHHADDPLPVQLLAPSRRAAVTARPPRGTPDKAPAHPAYLATLPEAWPPSASRTSPAGVGTATSSRRSATPRWSSSSA